MSRPRHVDIDWPALVRAFERFDPEAGGAGEPYLNVRTGKVAYFGASYMDVHQGETLNTDLHIALSLPSSYLEGRRARMRAFAATVAEPELSRRLREVLTSSDAIQGFYELLGEHQSTLSRWQRAEWPRIKEVIDVWVAQENLTHDRSLP